MAKEIPLTELAQLKKLMAMTTSTNDHEALAFLRKANAILAKYGLTWTEVLSRTVSAGTGNEIETAGEEMPVREQIQRALDELRGNIDSGFAEFVEKMEIEFKAKGYLSPGKRAPLFRAVRNLRERRKRDA